MSAASIPMVEPASGIQAKVIVGQVGGVSSLIEQIPNVKDRPVVRNSHAAQEVVL